MIARGVDVALARLRQKRGSCVRPKAIITFERLFVLGIIVSAVPYVPLMTVISPGEQAVVAVVIAVSVLLVLLASRRRSNVARWVLSALTAVGLARAGYLIGRAMGADAFNAEEAIDLISVALQFVAVAMLWTPTARAWFAGRDVAA